MPGLIKHLLIVLAVLLALLACRKEEKFTTDASAKLEFSTDTIIFDTVFSTVGSVTKWLKVYNRNKNAIRISEINILGETTQYRMNVDGIPGRRIKDVEIQGEDSIFVFIEVTVNPNDDLLPFLITDQIQFITNGNNQLIDLVAYGQNAIFYTPNVFTQGLPPYSLAATGDGIAEVVTWDSILPIVIYGFVVVDEFDKLIIEEGTKIYIHNSGGLWIFQGANIEINGTKDHPVVFQGDRLDAPFNQLSGQWDRIWINEAPADKPNIINHAIIKNAFIGIQAETLPFERIDGFSPNTLQLSNTIIENCSARGLLATNYRIAAQNVLITDCGQFNFHVQGGGQYVFDHCTFGNFWNESTRTTPAVFLQNFYNERRNGVDVTIAVPLPQVDFNNCILYGNNATEFAFEQVTDDVELTFRFDHSLLVTENDTTDDPGNYSNTIINPDNRFVFIDPFTNDFHLAPGSPAIDAGINKPSSPPTDLDEVSRTADGSPDLGAYEFVP